MSLCTSAIVPSAVMKAPAIGEILAFTEIAGGFGFRERPEKVP
jgi:hypothetical protein